MNNQTVINEIHLRIKELYPEAVSVTLFVNSDGIEVTPKYRSNISGFSMQDINGRWVKRSERK